MNSPGIDKEVENARPQATRNLAVLLVYEDLSTGLRARRVLEQVAGQFELEADFKVDLWKFDLLRDPALRERAAHEAAQADIVFLSAHGGGELPGTVSLWLEQWFERAGGEPGALAVLLDTTGEDVGATRQTLEALRATALEAGVEVFVHSVSPILPAEQSLLDEIPWRPEVGTALPDGILHLIALHPHRDWGINE